MHPDPAALERLGRRGAARDAYAALIKIADDRGIAVIAGGVRGWAELFGCSPSYPKQALHTLVEEEVIAVDFLGEGLAEVTLLRYVRDDQRPAMAVAGEEVTGTDTASQCGDRSITDRSPPTPPHVVHDSCQEQQQHDRAREDTEPVRAEPAGPPDDAVAWEPWARAAFPAVEAGVVARIAAHPGFDAGASTRALRGRPEATLREFAAELVAATERPGVRTPLGLLLAVWRDGGVVMPLAAPAPVAKPAQAKAPPRDDRRGRRTPLPPPPPASERDILEAPGLDADERGSWLAKFRSAPEADRADVLHAFWTWWGEREQARKSAPPEAERPDMRLNQTWHATLDAIRREVTHQEFNTWFRGSTLIALDEGVATVVSGGQWQQEGLATRYAPLIRRALGDVLCCPVALRVVLRGEEP